MKINLFVSAVVIALVSAPVLAAKPKSFKSSDNVALADGSMVDAAVVVCTNSQEVTLPKIAKKWCTDIDATYCSRDRMKAAKKACR